MARAKTREIFANPHTPHLIVPLPAAPFRSQGQQIAEACLNEAYTENSTRHERPKPLLLPSQDFLYDDGIGRSVSPYFGSIAL
jgi:hypothetical protein